MKIHFIATLVLLHLALEPLAAAATPTVAEIIAKHRETTDAIQELKCDFNAQVNWSNRGPEDKSGMYLKSRDIVRIREGATGVAMLDVRIENDEARAVNRHWSGPQKIAYNAYKTRRNRFISNGEMQIAFLIHGFPGRGKVKHSLEELYTFSESKISTKLEDLDGTPCVLVTLNYRTERNIAVEVRHWHDLQNGFLIVKSVIEYDRVRFEIRLTGIQEQNGARFPTRRVAKSTYGGKVEYDETLTLTNLILNKPIPAKDLDLPTFPSGTKCSDNISMKEYPIDSAWRAIGPEKDMVIYTSTTVSDPVTSELGNTSTEVEPKSTSYWILVVSMVVSILASTGVFFVRWRKSKSTN